MRRQLNRPSGAAEGAWDLRDLPGPRALEAVGVVAPCNLPARSRRGKRCHPEPTAKDPLRPEENVNSCAPAQGSFASLRMTAGRSPSAQDDPGLSLSHARDIAPG